MRASLHADTLDGCVLAKILVRFWPRNPRNAGMKLLFAILTKKASFKQRLLRAQFLNINMRTYITSALGHMKKMRKI